MRAHEYIHTSLKEILAEFFAEELTEIEFFLPDDNSLEVRFSGKVKSGKQTLGKIVLSECLFIIIESLEIHLGGMFKKFTHVPDAEIRFVQT